MRDKLLWPFRGAHYWLMAHHVVRCEYCDDTGSGCDCGACDVVYSGSPGYAWCMNVKGCPLCGRSR